MARVDLLLLCWVLFELKASLAHISYRVSKRNRLRVPVGDPEVCRGRRGGWLQTLDPVTGAWKFVAWFPALVPETGHCVVWYVVATNQELSGRATLVPGVRLVCDTGKRGGSR